MIKKSPMQEIKKYVSCTFHCRQAPPGQLLLNLVYEVMSLT